MKLHRWSAIPRGIRAGSPLSRLVSGAAAQLLFEVLQTLVAFVGVWVHKRGHAHTHRHEELRRERRFSRGMREYARLCAGGRQCGVQCKRGEARACIWVQVFRTNLRGMVMATPGGLRGHRQLLAVRVVPLGPVRAFGVRDGPRGVRSFCPTVCMRVGSPGWQHDILEWIVLVYRCDPPRHHVSARSHT